MLNFKILVCHYYYYNKPYRNPQFKNVDTKTCDGDKIHAIPP